jgi:hypothetical protein
VVAGLSVSGRLSPCGEAYASEPSWCWRRSPLAAAARDRTASPPPPLHPPPPPPGLTGRSRGRVPQRLPLLDPATRGGGRGRALPRSRRRLRLAGSPGVATRPWSSGPKRASRASPPAPSTTR